jgi:AcrR family transcriptional regulator
MGVKERRAREREEIRGRILDAARELFAARGYEAVTMRKIAEAIEYSPTAIYLHFADKLDVLRACCDADFRLLAKKFRKIAEIADPIERLKATGRAYADFGFKHPNHYQLMFMTPKPPVVHEASDIERGNPEEDAYAFLKGTVGAAIASGRLRPELDDVELLSQVVWAGVHGVVSLRIAKCKDDWVDWAPERKSVEAMLDLQIHGLLARGAE